MITGLQNSAGYIQRFEVCLTWSNSKYQTVRTEGNGGHRLRCIGSGPVGGFCEDDDETFSTMERDILKLDEL
jgi:hypothetical protein